MEDHRHRSGVPLGDLHDHLFEGFLFPAHAQVSKWPEQVQLVPWLRKWLDVDVVHLRKEHGLKGRLVLLH